MVAVIIFFIVHWYLSLFSQTFFLHRYAAHRMFTMNKFWERYFSLLSYISQGSSYLSPRAYAVLHRMHHAFSDTEKDPHSPHHTKNIFTMMWKTKTVYIQFAYDKVKPEARFDSRPIWRSLEKLGENWFSRFAWGTLYTLIYIWFYLQFNMPWYFFFLLPIHYLMGPVHGAIVNWAGHMYGYSNYDNNDKSKNSLILDVLMMGELFQNNHHKLPQNLNFGSRWFEFDPTYPIIKMLMWLKIIKLNPQPVGHH
ncbi:MAG: acyl-CoA desaturase [Bacteroidota bacterium]